ncbi:hypothetical protein TEA_019652 [Camellia sinensis var. sinensis]|uniref:Uncharacterized protein n=1 Tax=Camellia sinensis var. sinensis TaxID=542762 RepID=A0A4S4EG97_CAMSN|nr:hypothetical protein TEA_019652 [Camellia sinensis var. sinensis]
MPQIHNANHALGIYQSGKAQVIIVEPNDLMDKKQHISIFTTASLPWMTGTAVNPLFRAAYLAKDKERKFSSDKRSILAVGDITEAIPDEEADIAVLEEPEHLTWYHHGKRRKTKFRLVVGVVHTNYLEYVRREKNGQLQAFFLKYINSWVDLPRSIICNIHGVNPKFLEIGKKKNEEQQNGNQAFTKGAYYIGKMVWSKGYKELLKLLCDHQKDLSGVEVDLYGNGEDSAEIQEAANKLELTVRVHPGCDHADPLFHDYKVFLNPSTTDVVCTTSAEALAMGKIVWLNVVGGHEVSEDHDDDLPPTKESLEVGNSPLTSGGRWWWWVLAKGVALQYDCSDVMALGAVFIKVLGLKDIMAITLWNN